jgi:preprotein translocase subunit SecD
MLLPMPDRISTKWDRDLKLAMSMNAEGAKTWQRMTKENIGKSIAIVLDGYVRSFPNVHQ